MEVLWSLVQINEKKGDLKQESHVHEDPLYSSVANMVRSFSGPQNVEI